MLLQGISLTAVFLQKPRVITSTNTLVTMNTMITYKYFGFTKSLLHQSTTNLVLSPLETKYTSATLPGVGEAEFEQ